jgi:hypothetical protein
MLRYRTWRFPPTLGAQQMGVPFKTGAPSAKYWQDRANEVRANMAYVRTPVARAVLLEVAQRYEKLAQEAAKRKAEQA